MGMITRLLNSIDGVYWFPVISMGLFIVLFSGVVIHTLMMKKSRELELGRMPLDIDEQ